jgi:hypothetical protein
MTCIMYIIPQHNLTLTSHLMVFLYIIYTVTVLVYDFTAFRLVFCHIDVEVAQKWTQLLPDDSIVLPKHVAAIVKKYRTQFILLVILYTNYKRSNCSQPQSNKPFAPIPVFLSHIDRLWNKILCQISVHFRHPWRIKQNDFTRQVITRTLSKIYKRNLCEGMLVNSTWLVGRPIDPSSSAIKNSPKTYGSHSVLNRWISGLSAILNQVTLCITSVRLKWPKIKFFVVSPRIEMLTLKSKNNIPYR